MKNVDIFYQIPSSLEEHFIIELPDIIKETLPEYNPIYNNILISKLLGLSYPDFLLYLKEEFKITLINNNNFIYPVFNKKQYRKFLELLNRHWGKLHQKVKLNKRRI